MGALVLSPASLRPGLGGGIRQPFSIVGLTPPARTEWIANLVASFHTTPDVGILSYVRPPPSSCPSIMVDDETCLPVTSVGSTTSPRLSNVLVAP